MYNSSNEEYIRSILGYSNNTNNALEQKINQNRELEEYYPEIYKIVYPMVKKACNNVSNKLTKEEIDNIVDELYSNIEGNTVAESSTVNQSFVNNSSNQENRSIVKKEETRSFNSGLCDLIRILLLRELIGRPKPPHNNRPPFLPPFMPPRPPFYRNINDDIYEY